MNQGDLEKAFIQSFGEYGDAIFRFCMVKVSRVELAEDMTQEVFMRYWQYLRDGKEITHTRALLYTIANNMAKDWYKKKKADSLNAKKEQGFEPGAEGDQEQMAMYHEVLSAMEGLDEKDKEVLLLRHVEGYGPNEIAEMLGESANVVSVRLNRATKRLQQQLGYG
jgi:RNA polymerase sigma-70 factor (ECF subfamily)